MDLDDFQLDEIAFQDAWKQYLITGQLIVPTSMRRVRRGQVEEQPQEQTIEFTLEQLEEAARSLQNPIVIDPPTFNEVTARSFTQEEIAAIRGRYTVNIDPFDIPDQRDIPAPPLQQVDPNYEIDFTGADKLEAMMQELDTKEIEEKSKVIVKKVRKPTKAYLELLNSKGWFTDENAIFHSNDVINTDMKFITSELLKLKLSYIPESGDIINYIAHFTSYANTSFQKNVRKLPIFMKIMEEFYKDRWDIIWNKGSNYLCLIIYYPELLITDEDSRTNLMKELYVSIHLSSTVGIYYTRSQINEDELQVGYTFSHGFSLGRATGNNYIVGDVCMGSETAFPLMLTSLGAKKEDDETVEDDIYLLFYQLEKFFTNEYSTGVPTVRIKYMYEQTGKYINQSMNAISFVSDLKKELKKDRRAIIPGTIESYGWLDKRLYILGSNSKLVEMLMSMESVPKCFYNSGTRTYYTVDGGSRNLSLTQTYNELVGKTVITYKGEKKKFKITPSEKKQDELTEKIVTIHPDVIQQAINIINEIFSHHKT